MTFIKYNNGIYSAHIFFYIYLYYKMYLIENIILTISVYKMNFTFYCNLTKVGIIMLIEQIQTQLKILTG